MSVGRTQTNVFDDYEYLDENCIDAELKCPLCMSPFQSPMSGTCGHTFCQECIHPWIIHHATCPTCRLRSSTEDFRPISTRIVINQLDRLLLRCKRCSQTNIPRGDFNEHQKRCPDQLVSCPAFDIKCPWKGTRHALTTHLEECSFQKIRPVIDDIYEELKNHYEPFIDELQKVRKRLERRMIELEEQNHFLLTVFNRGKPMTDRCPHQQQYCCLRHQLPVYGNDQRDQHDGTAVRRIPNEKTIQHRMMEMAIHLQVYGTETAALYESKKESKTTYLFNCAHCQKDVKRSDVCLHHCQGGVICRVCFDDYGNLGAAQKGLRDE